MSEQTKSSSERAALLRFADEIVADIFATADETILAEFRKDHGDPSKYANTMRSRVRFLAIETNKGRLVAARAALKAERQKQSSQSHGVEDLRLARAALTNLLNRPANSIPVTLAARKEKISEMSDADIAGVVADLELLGFVIRKRERTDKEKKSSENDE